MPVERFKLAILYDPHAKLAPSNSEAIVKFCDAALNNGMDVEIIGEEDYFRLTDFDALFIRETTYRDHYTSNFAQTAHNLGLFVIDHPKDIYQCTDKVNFHKRCDREGIPTPLTLIVNRSFQRSYYRPLSGFPLVYKSPYGCFSRDIYKVDNEAEHKVAIEKLYAENDNVLVQTYMPTDFDWRICILNGEVLFAIKYYMAEDDWRILKHCKDGKPIEGNHECIPYKEVPAKALQLAFRLSSIYGSGLYGIDIKEFQGQFYAIEVNDNPSIDSGIEDELYPELYDKIMKHFRCSLEALHRLNLEPYDSM